jgi:nitroreductase
MYQKRRYCRCPIPPEREELTNVSERSLAKVEELATHRKTSRIFSGNPVNVEDVLYCIRVAAQAPSGANRQPWRFVLVDDPQIMKKARAACENQEKRFHESTEKSLKEWFRSKNITWRKPFLTDAPTLLAVFSDQKMPYATESTWLAIGYVILALEERSLSTLTYTPSHSENVRSVFNAPKEYKLEVILPIGYSADTKPKQPRRPFLSSVYRNAWNTPLGRS